MIYFMADVFAGPTYADMFPMVDLVVLACGTTTITYRTDGSLEAHYFLNEVWTLIWVLYHWRWKQIVTIRMK
ncbi:MULTISPECIES: hypothetical protein [Bacteroides]|nr:MULTISPECIES: hypothetical protein [Bacteroides]MCA6004235.1 hypothetical protein [Bacteroides thetaiotaomicron]MCM1734038.1 hypothetical protein [Bacteroides faecis]MCM1770543.1 hypothetical protein [Bacteroides faecis]MCM1775632.1 hypothetical protein [Bacteroides faecis]MCM1920466.1 hypothetical protein [Bacteroides faecis]